MEKIFFKPLLGGSPLAVKKWLQMKKK